MRRSMTLALTLLGLFDSLYLLYTYTSPSRPMVCIGTGCDAVRASAWSTMWGVSMPIFGVLGYTLLAIALFSESLLPARLARWARYGFLGMTGFGFAFSLYLEYLQTFAIHAYCAWCVTSGVVMTALFALAIVNVRRAGPEPDPAAQLTDLRSLFAVGVASLLVGAPVFYLLTLHGETAPAAHQPTAINLAERLVRAGSHETGDPDAPLTVVEFGDFECPVCARGEEEAREIRAQYSGEIRFVFRQFPLDRIHPFARKAAEASECAGEQGKFWDMVEKIYSRQEDLTVEGLERDAAELGLDRARFHGCLASGAMAGRVRQDEEDARALGVRGTPTFFIGRQMVEGVLPTARFSELIAGHLAALGVSTAGNAKPSPAPAAAAPRKAAVQADPSKLLDGSRAKAETPPAAPKTAAAGIGQAPADSLRRPAPGGLGIGLPGAAAPGGIFGQVQAASGTCNEADAAKTQPALIGTQELRRLLTSGANVLFVDVRPAGDYAAGRIPGAISLPADELDRRWSSLPKDRTIILYEGGKSSGDICAASRAAGRSLLEHGLPFSRVKVYQDGLAGWNRAEPRIALPEGAGHK